MATGFSFGTTVFSSAASGFGSAPSAFSFGAPLSIENPLKEPEEDSNLKMSQFEASEISTGAPLSIENPFKDPEEDSDVKVTVGDYILHLDSWLLSHYSPVFKTMLNGKFKEEITKEIELKDKDPEHVIEMFKYFYPTRVPQITEKTKFKELFPLCREYQLNWLKSRLEDYLDTLPVSAGGRSEYFHSLSNGKYDNCVTTLWLTEEYGLKESLKDKLINICKNVTYCSLTTKDWNRVSKETVGSILLHRAEFENFQTFSLSLEDWKRISLKVRYEIATKRLSTLISDDTGGCKCNYGNLKLTSNQHKRDAYRATRRIEYNAILHFLHFTNCRQNH